MAAQLDINVIIKRNCLVSHKGIILNF